MTAAASAQAITQVLTQVMRADKGRLLAALSYRLRDIALAEEMLQEACISAMSHWGRTGLPDNPQGWLLRVALRRAIDRLRAHARALGHLDGLIQLADERAAIDEAPEIPDDRLRLMMACCHPALEPKSQIALTLRVICGLTTQQIAAVFLDNDVAIGQRISRAKAKIKAAGIGFAIPAPDAWPARLNSVLTAVYLTFTLGYAAGVQAGQELCSEALFLARLLVTLAPNDPETEGALALILITQARAGARGQGAMIGAQNRKLWDEDMMGEGLALIKSALGRGQVGPFQIKAALAACHIAEGGPDWPQIGALLLVLLGYEDTPVVRLSLAVATAEVHGPAVGLALLEPISQDLDAYGPFHAARADMLARCHDPDAYAAYTRAIDLAESSLDTHFLTKQRENLPRDRAEVHMTICKKKAEHKLGQSPTGR